MRAAAHGEDADGIARDIDGGVDIARLYFLVASTAAPTAGGCHGFYDRATNGLYLYNDRRIAIELEISRKSSDEYAEICGWYAEQAEVDELHWYVDSPALQRYIERVVRRNGLGIDLGVFVFPLPRGVRVREWA